MNPRPPGSIDVARRAGVSRSTVSYVLGGNSDRFSDETIQRVHQAVAELGYVPSSAGRALVRGRSDIVIIVFPFTTMPQIQDIVEVLSEGLAEHGFNAVVQLSGPPHTEVHQRVRHVAESLRPAGVIDLGGLTRQDHAELRALGSVVVGTAVDGDGAGSNFAIGRAQAEHLVDRGYRQLAYAFLMDGRGHPFDQSRTEGARVVCDQNRLAEPYLFGVPLDAAGAISSVATMLKVVPGPVGVGCFEDDVALAVVHAATSLGRAVPEDMGVVGVGRAAVGQLARPRLSSVWGDGAPLASLLDDFLAQHGGREPGTVAVMSRLEVEQGETT